jgi:hypothetical protein
MSKQAKRTPFNATDGRVYHDNSKCYAGRSIVAHRQKGTGQKAHCPICAKLNSTE